MNRAPRQEPRIKAGSGVQVLKTVAASRRYAVVSAAGRYMRTS